MSPVSQVATLCSSVIRHKIVWCGESNVIYSRITGQHLWLIFQCGGKRKKYLPLSSLVSLLSFAIHNWIGFTNMWTWIWCDALSRLFPIMQGKLLKATWLGWLSCPVSQFYSLKLTTLFLIYSRLKSVNLNLDCV